MNQPISAVTPFPTLATVGKVGDEATPQLASLEKSSARMSFQDVLLQSLDQVAQSDERAQSLIEQGLVTGDLNQAEIFVAMKKADMAYRTLVQVRNQAIDAFNELQQMRM